jgi:hypothetical protein
MAVHFGTRNERIRTPSELLLMLMCAVSLTDSATANSLPALILPDIACRH